MKINHQQNFVKRDYSSKVYKTYIKFISCYWDEPNIDTYENEKYWLEKLKKSPYFPKILVSEDDKRMLIVTDCGEHLNMHNIPDDLLTQRDNILNELQKYNCRHNDIKPSEIVIKDGKLNIIDFGWAYDYDKSNPDNWPDALGAQYKSVPHDDHISFNKSLIHILESIHQKIHKEIEQKVKNIENKLNNCTHVSKTYTCPDDVDDQVQWWKDLINSLNILKH